MSDEAILELFEERCSLHEVEGGLPPKGAEAAAVVDVRNVLGPEAWRLNVLRAVVRRGIDRRRG